MSSFDVSATVKYTVHIKRIPSGTRLYRSQQEVFNELKLQSSWFRDKPNCGFKVNELRNCELSSDSTSNVSDIIDGIYTNSLKTTLTLNISYLSSNILVQ